MAKLKHKKPIAILTIVAFLLSMLPAVAFGAVTSATLNPTNYISTTVPLTITLGDVPALNDVITVELTKNSTTYTAIYTIAQADVDAGRKDYVFNISDFKDTSSNVVPFGSGYSLSVKYTPSGGTATEIASSSSFNVIPAVASVTPTAWNEAKVDLVVYDGSNGITSGSVIAVYLDSNTYESAFIDKSNVSSFTFYVNRTTGDHNYTVKYITGSNNYVLATGIIPKINPYANAVGSADGKATLNITKPESNNLYVGQSVTSIEGTTDKDAVVDVYVLAEDTKITNAPIVWDVISATVNPNTGTFIADLSDNFYKNEDVIFAVVAKSSKGTTVKYITHGYKFDGSQSIASPVIGQEVKISGTVFKYDETSSKYVVAQETSYNAFEVYYSNGATPYNRVTGDSNYYSSIGTVGVAANGTVNFYITPKVAGKYLFVLRELGYYELTVSGKTATATLESATAYEGRNYKLTLKSLKVGDTSVSGSTYYVVIEGVPVADSIGTNNKFVKYTTTPVDPFVSSDVRTDSVGNKVYDKVVLKFTANPDLSGLVFKGTGTAKVTIYALNTKTIFDQKGYDFTSGNSAIKAVYVSASGAGMTPVNNIELKAGAMTVTTNTIKIGGSVNITVNAKVTVNGTDTWVTKTVSIPVKGFVPTVSVSQSIYDQETALTVTVKDVNGNPINNAIIAFDKTDIKVKGSDGTFKDAAVVNDKDTIVDGTVTNITDGNYSATIKADTPGSTNIYVIVMKKLADGTTTYETWAKVPYTFLGYEKYTVTADKTALLANYPENVKITVKDGANVVTGTGFKVSLKHSDTTASISQNSLSDLNNVTLDSTGSFTLGNLNVSKPGTLTITVTSNNGTSFGTVKIDVVAPKVVLTPSDNVITDSVKESIKAVIYDPRNNAEIKLPIDFAIVKDSENTNTLSVLSVYQKDGKTIATDSDKQGASTYEFVILAQYNKDAKAAPQFEVKVNGIKVATFDVKPAVVAVSSDKVTVAVPKAITVTAKDAHGKALAGYVVTLSGAGVSQELTLDSNGQVTTYIQSNATGDINVELKDVANETIAKIKSDVFVDTQAPVITVTAPEKVEVPYVDVTVKVTDNDKVAALAVNNAAVALVAPAAEVNKVVRVNLVEGDNTIVVEAADLAGNVASKTITVKYEKPVTPPPANNGGNTNTGDKYSKYVGQMVQLTYTKTNLRVAPQANAKILAVLKKGYKMRYLGREGVWNKVRVSIWSNGGYKTYTGYIYDPNFWTLTSVQ
ncbi:SH3 domain-containing protein [Carboxydothermus hydrogenoformans]|uniref:SH3b domain-containing protein n=1 Tax=Carboxydothermus hydrogenoformans (strain ATCC BAA-161 / DSM 6008 / Z-2901) TaxID=246194 RepID=Q3A968_CARHZ|nr:SH3 domain-containing protein [Carboxydothermus hydrogenoformans]ABB14859.1 hypothetical protein CHY_2523 [Carboxydothermus hydrogenoformans Z-2901]